MKKRNKKKKQVNFKIKETKGQPTIERIYDTTIPSIFFFLEGH